MKQREFEREIEARLNENRRVAAGSPVPSWLQPAAAYLGFYPVRVLVLLALLATLIQMAFFYEITMNLSRSIFFYG
jgi:hypothetical protein